MILIIKSCEDFWYCWINIFYICSCFLSIVFVLSSFFCLPLFLLSLLSILWFHFLFLSYHINYTSFKTFFSGYPWVCTIHLQVIQAVFQIIFHFMDSANDLQQRIPSSSLLSFNTLLSLIVIHMLYSLNTLLLLLFWINCYLSDQ